MLWNMQQTASGASNLPIPLPIVNLGYDTAAWLEGPGIINPMNMVMAGLS